MNEGPHSCGKTSGDEVYRPALSTTAKALPDDNQSGLPGQPSVELNGCALLTINPSKSLMNV